MNQTDMIPLNLMDMNLSSAKWRRVCPVAYFTKDVNSRLAKRPLETNRRLGNRWLTSLVKQATGPLVPMCISIWVKSAMAMDAP